MRRITIIIVAIAIAALFCLPLIPWASEAQTSPNQGLVVIKTDYMMVGLSELTGGGHLTYELRGNAARDLRRAILAAYDFNNNSRIDVTELENYIDAMEEYLENPPLEFTAGETNSFAPRYKDADITRSAIGIINSANIESDLTPIKIYLYFDSTSNYGSYPNEPLVSEEFIDALFLPPLLRDSVNNTRGILNPGSYMYKYKHTDFRVSASSIQSFRLKQGKLHMVRTPAGEIGQYTVTFEYGEFPTDDRATFKSFDILENPQILFVLVFVCGFITSTVPTRMYSDYKFAFPRRFRGQALKIKWLHILSKVMIVLMILFYFLPTIFCTISPNLFMSGLFMWIFCIAITITFSVLAKVLYDDKKEHIPKEYLETYERRPVRRPLTPLTRTPAGVSVVVQQPGQQQQPVQQSAPAAVVAPIPAPAKEEKPSGPPCVVCGKPIANYTDLHKCKCGQLYHEECAEVAKHCTKCGAALVEIIPEGPAMKDVQCPTCGEMNSVEEGLDLLLAKCGKCGVILEKVADGYNYLVVDNDHTTAFKMFVYLLKNGCTGLSISTTFPDKLRKEHQMDNAEVIWLTDTSVADKKTINPHRLEFEMMRMYAAFVKGNPKSAIILDGFEYLVVENGFDKVFKFIKKINDLSSVNNATLIVPIGTSSLEPDQLGTLKKEFDKVIDMVGNGED